MKAMILAAGFGTRLQPLTDSLPKALIPLAGKPMIEHTIEALIRSGVTEIVVNLHHHAEIMRSYFQRHRFDAAIHLIEEKEILGTGGGIANARALLDGANPFLVHNVDIFSEVDLQSIYSTCDANALATLVVNKRKTSRPLFVDRGGIFLGKVEWFREESWENRLQEEYAEVGFCGIHVLSPKIFSLMPEGAYDIFETYRRAVEARERIRVKDIGDAFWIDLGTKDRIAQCEKRLGDR